jgi:NAD(P)-binding Rossmann-like domain
VRTFRSASATALTIIGDAGITPDAAEEMLRILHRERIYDAFHITGANYSTMHMNLVPSASGLRGHFAVNSARAKAIVNDDVAVLVSSGSRDLSIAAEIVGEGKADIVSMVRAQMAHPDLITKARSGRRAEIGHCVGMNQACISRAAGGMRASCTVNPFMGRERDWRSRLAEHAQRSRSVLIVGGAPAGLTLAETAAMRGHSVTLVEREQVLGGSLRVAGRLPGRSAWLEMADELEAAARRAGAKLSTGEEATADTIGAVSADVVVVATGGRFEKTGRSMRSAFGRQVVPGLAEVTVLDPIEAISEPERATGAVLVVSDNGDHLPLGLSVLLAQRGHAVTLVTAQMMAGENLLSTLELPWIYPEVLATGVEVIVQSYVDRISDGEAIPKGIWGYGSRSVPVDAVVFSRLRESRSSLYDELAGRAGLELHRIGDARAPRDVDDAIYEGVRLALELQ